jgi:ABC-type phosphate/phosphonate transport system permease subunit
MQLRRPRLGSFSMVQDRVVDTPIVREPALTVIARLGFAARGLLYLLVGGFAVAAALGLGQQPHGIMDVLTALMDTRLQTVLAAVIGLGLACLAGYFAIRGLSHCCRGSGARRWLFGAGMIADALIYGLDLVATVWPRGRWLHRTCDPGLRHRGCRLGYDDRCR